MSKVETSLFVVCFSRFYSVKMSFTLVNNNMHYEEVKYRSGFDLATPDSITEQGKIFGMDDSFPNYNFSNFTFENTRRWSSVNIQSDAINVEQQHKLTEDNSNFVKRKCNEIDMTDEEETCDSPADIDIDSVASPLERTMPLPRKRAKIIPLKNEKLSLPCEWEDCSYFTEDMEKFLYHVANHIPELDVRENAQSEEVYGCLWSLCDFETSDPEEVKRHVNFHSYHTKIKCIGNNLLERTPGLHVCSLEDSSKNLFSDLPDPFVCNWDSCNRVFSNSQLFFYHTRGHIETNKRGNNVKGGIQCLWTSCKYSFRSLYRLAEHVRTHTQEKCVACPNCGGLFASGTKLLDHCKRQTPIAIAGESFQCSHCSKYFPSERLLRDHMRHHVNHYKCVFCDMTCPTPSALSLHIRYKHLTDKPFRCHFCGFRAKTKCDLSAHTNTHSNEPLYKCEEKDCDFTCRSAYGLTNHHRKTHVDDEPSYCCHLCDERFYRGAYLTQHLFKTHDFRWPNGHCRFRYKNEQGLFHLQTVRYESLEVTEEMMRAENSNVQPPYAQPNIHSKSKSVLITIAQLDDKGNVVSANEVDADELSDVPCGATAITEGGVVHLSAGPSYTRAEV